MLSCDTLSTERVWRWKNFFFAALKKFANWKKLLTAGFSWAILEQEIRKKPLVYLVFVSCRVCPAGRNVEITAACHERKNIFAPNDFSTGRECSLLNLFGQFWNSKFERTLISCLAVPSLAAPIPRSNSTCRQTWKWKKNIVFAPNKFENWQKMLAARSPWTILEQEARKKLFCFVSCRVTAPREKNVFAPKRVCELEENAHRWIFLGNSGSNWAPLSAFVQLRSVEE